MVWGMKARTGKDGKDRGMVGKDRGGKRKDRWIEKD